MAPLNPPTGLAGHLPVNRRHSKKYCIVSAKIQHQPYLPAEMPLIALVYSGGVVRLPYLIGAQVPNQRRISSEKSKRILPHKPYLVPE